VKLLLDAHTLYWAIYQPERLSGDAREALADVRNSLFVSLATLWELLNKAAVNRLPLAGASVVRVLQRVEQLSVTFLPIERSEIMSAATLPHHHGDPFDRILIAQANAHGLTLVTRDRNIA
jgi:PIN domain nuclease of toxin-antitoxin system